MSSPILSSRVNYREVELRDKVGHVSICSALAFWGSKMIATTITPLAGAIFMGSSVAISQLAGYIFKNNSNRSFIELAAFCFSIPIAATYVHITLANALLVTAITGLSIVALRIVNNMI